MTAQATDTFLFKGKPYELIGITEGDLFSSQDFGIEAEFINTACWRGFYSTYEIADKRIFLKEMTVLLEPRKDGKCKTINNVLPQQISDDEALYKEINLPVSSFTGKIRIARSFIDELYIHMGFPKPSAFKTVLDLTFEGGELKETKNRSREMKKKRGTFKKLYNKHCKNGKIGQAVEEAFSLNMDLE